MRAIRLALIVLAASVLLAAAPAARAAAMYKLSAVGSTAGGRPIDFDAVFTLASDSLTIELTNHADNPVDAAQTIRSIAFRLSGVTAAPTFSAFSGISRDVNGNGVGAYVDVPITSVDWTASNVADVYRISADGPDYLVIGDPAANNAYAAANNSIKNNAHNPHLANSAVFTLAIAGVTETTLITDVVFGNGTSSETIDASDPLRLTLIPTPAAGSMGGVLMLALAALRRRHRA